MGACRAEGRPDLLVMARQMNVSGRSDAASADSVHQMIQNEHRRVPDCA
jgi:hypothetical protein